MKKMKILLLLSLTLAFFSNINAFAESGSVLKNDSLRATPFADAKIIGNVIRAENVTILQKQGAWLQIKTAKSTGWVRLLSVKRGTTATANNLRGATAVATGRAGTGQVVSTTGVRGLSEQELKAASFNETEIKLLESYAQTETQAKQFATSGGLKTQPFANLTAPTTANGVK